MTFRPSPSIIRPPSSPLAVGERGVIAGFTQADYASSLMAMGVLPGSTIEVKRRAPFGGAVYVVIDEQMLALRLQELEAIVIDK
ncbi:MAG: FeoA family protein [Bacteroidota bacterium]